MASRQETYDGRQRPRPGHALVLMKEVLRRKGDASWKRLVRFLIVILQVYGIEAANFRGGTPCWESSSTTCALLSLVHSGQLGGGQDPVQASPVRHTLSLPLWAVLIDACASQALPTCLPSHLVVRVHPAGSQDVPPSHPRLDLVLKMAALTGGICSPPVKGAVGRL